MKRFQELLEFLNKILKEKQMEILDIILIDDLNSVVRPFLDEGNDIGDYLFYLK